MSSSPAPARAARGPRPASARSPRSAGRRARSVGHEPVEGPIETCGIGRSADAELMSSKSSPKRRTTSLARRGLVRSPSADRASDASAQSRPGSHSAHCSSAKELISNEQLELALMDQQGTGLRLGELLVQWGWVDSAAISQALAEQYDMEFFDLDAAEIEPAAVRALPAAEARTCGAIPIRVLDGGRLLVGVADPTDVGRPATSCAPSSVAKVTPGRRRPGRAAPRAGPRVHHRRTEPPGLPHRRSDPAFRVWHLVPDPRATRRCRSGRAAACPSSRRRSTSTR